MPAPPSEERSQAASVHNVPTHPVPHEQKEKRTKTKNKKGSRKEENDSSEQQQQQQQEDINHPRDLAKSNAKPTRSRNNERISVDSKPANTIQEKNKTAVNVTGDSLLATDTLEETSSLEKPAKSTNKRKGRNRNKKKAGQETVQEEVTSVEEKQATEAPTKSQDTPSLQTEPPTQAKTRNNKRGKHQKKTEQNTDEQPTGLAEPALEKKPPKVEERTRRPSGQPEESKEVIESIPKDEEVTHKRQPRKPRQRSKKTKEVKEVEPKLPQTSVEQEVQKPSSISLPPPTPPSHPAAQVNSTTPVAHAITTSSSMNNNSTTPSDDVSVDRTPQEQPVYNGHRNSNPYLSRPMEPYYNNDLHQSMATSTPAHHPIPQHEYYYQHPQPVYPMIDYSMMMPYDYTTGMPAGMYNYPPAPLPPLVPSQQPSQPVQPQQTQPYMQPMYCIPDMASQRQQSPSYYNHQMHYTQLYDDAGYRDYNSRGRGRGMTTSNGRGRGRSEPK
ncbi:hypothetical protein BD560DRAFT_181321 [Blakeslea trispora]|nr:hypothetical protein BD560DRAFT_181321 [Blakeslea trispora]